MPRLVPKVVVEMGCPAAVHPRAFDFELLRVEDRKTAGPVAIGVAEHANHDVVARHAVNRVRPRVPGLRENLLRLDYLLDPRRPWVVGDVNDVDPRRAEAGHDQVRAVGAVPGGTAAVPAV